MPKENNIHIIEKQIVEITTDKYENAQHLQNDVSRLFRYKITSALEKICNKYNSTKDIIRIDRMELDIGRLPMHEFDKLFCENSVEQFESKLEDIIAEINHSDKTSPKQKGISQIVSEKEAYKNQHLSETDKQFEILVQFLKTGNLPWHQLKNSNFDISELFMFLYEKQPEKLSIVLRILFKSKIVLKRFIYQFPKKIKQSTAELFLSHSQGSKIAELESIFIAYQHLYEHIKLSKKDLQYAIWDVILSRAIQQAVSFEKIIIPLVYKFLHFLNEANSSPESFFKDFLNFQVYYKKAVLNKQNSILTETQKIIDQITTLIFHKISSEKNSNTQISLLKSLKTTGDIKHFKKLRFKNELDKKTLTEILKQIESYEFDFGNKESEEFTAKHLKDTEILISDTSIKSQLYDEEKDANNEDLTKSKEYNKEESSKDKKKKGIDQKIENEVEKELTQKEDLTLKKVQKIDPHNSDETNIKETKSTLPDKLQQEQNSIHKNRKATIELEESEVQKKANLKKEEGDELRKSEKKDADNEDIAESTKYNIAESSKDKKKKGISQNTKDQKIENEEEKELTQKEDLTLKKVQKIDPHNSDETNIKEAKSTLPEELQQEQNSIHKNRKANIELEGSEVQDKAHLKKDKGNELRKSEENDADNVDLAESTEYNKEESSKDKKKKGISQNTKDQEIENKEENELTKKQDLSLKKLPKIDPHNSDETSIKEAKNKLPDKLQQEQNRERIENERSLSLKEKEDITSNKNKTYKKDTSETVTDDNIEENVSGELNTDNSTKEMSDSQGVSKELKTEPPKVKANQEEELVKQYLISKSVDEIIIENAGLVILCPYLPSLFKELDLLDDKKQFKDEQSKHLAIAITQYLVTGSEAVQEYSLIFNKLLCGIDLEEPIPVIEELPEHIKQSCQELLEIVVKNWTALKGTSIQSLQATFLQREGILTKAANGCKVQIERITLDILLDKLPWSISIIALPWRKELIYVEW